MNLKRFFAVFKARNIEFFRDRSSLGWNLFFPVLLLVGFSIIFSGDERPAYKVGLLGEQSQVSGVAQESLDDGSLKSAQEKLVQLRFIDFIHYKNAQIAKDKLSHHSLDLVIDFVSQKYWVNEESSKSYLIEKIFLGQQSGFERLQSTGKAIRYIDWVLPGILGMNMMFSCLFGVGYVIVRYRKNSVLKRLKATPLSAFEFISAQLFSRLFIVMFMSTVVYSGCNLFFDFFMLGRYIDLFLIGALGAFCLISLGLLIACRSKSDELIGGLLNLTSWPMIMLSGVWFSLEGSPEALKILADFMPLTHLVAGARAVITEGASLGDISYHINILLIMSSIFLTLGAYLFSWNAER
ncbi:MAG: ABC transporter permease [Colwellia sp.]